MEPLKIGVSARLLYPDPSRAFLPTKSVQYLEQSVANWVMSGDVLAFMIPEMSLASPTPHLPRSLTVKNYVNRIFAKLAVSSRAQAIVLWLSYSAATAGQERSARGVGSTCEAS